MRAYGYRGLVHGLHGCSERGGDDIAVCAHYGQERVAALDELGGEGSRPASTHTNTHVQTTPHWLHHCLRSPPIRAHARTTYTEDDFRTQFPRTKAAWRVAYSKKSSCLRSSGVLGGKLVTISESMLWLTTWACFSTATTCCSAIIFAVAASENDVSMWRFSSSMDSDPRAGEEDPSRPVYEYVA